ncbi:MAG: NAD(P)-dependent oxidoreductase [Acholeplasmataceae bacterium]|nr:NAD(P)-dependent oxidoreductase [Acholeplasmataceae bacterium]
MDIFMVGGTGLLGSEAAFELIKRGHNVSSIALPPLPIGAKIPKDMKLIFANYLELSDQQMKDLMFGMDGFIFAAGVDERIEGTKPIYDFYAKYNIIPLKKMIRIAKESGVKHVVVLGSYFSYFARIWEELDLYHKHPYIRSRVDQAQMALSFADDNMSVSVLELPYIFGTQPGRKPVWTFLIEQIEKMNGFTLYPNGGTTMLTVKQVGQCVASAIEIKNNGQNYPIGYYNMSWKEMLSIFHKYMGVPNKKIITIPKFIYLLAMKSKVKEYKKKHIETGFDLIGLVQIMTRHAYIDKELVIKTFGVTDDDIDQAIGQSVKLSMDFIHGKKDIIDMRGE